MDKNIRDNADKLFRIQKQAKEDVKTMQSYISDLLNWESEMKRKEAALQGAYEQDLPPVRSKKKKVIESRPAKPAPRINSFDYASWDKFDVDKAIEQVDMADVGPSSLDSKKSLPAKNAKLTEEAAYEKERGNQFVKSGKWEEAIQCYNRAIEIDNRDAIFYANRALCYLKLDKLHKAESDCTKALCLDSTYVKALLRRATAREKLGSLKAASEDLAKVVELEPNNAAAKKQLAAIKLRMGSKGGTSKSSPQRSPTADNKASLGAPNTAKIQEIKTTLNEVKPQEKTELEKWRDGDGENICVIKPVKKPPHLRSKRPLKPITIKEIPFGRTEPELPKPTTRIQITEFDDLSHGDTNNNKNTQNSPFNEKKPSDKGDFPLTNGIQNKEKITEIDNKELINGEVNKDKEKHVDEPEHANKDEHVNKEHVNKDNKSINIKDLVAPINSVQFMLEWRSLKDVDGGRSDYLSLIDPSKIPLIFDNALESDVLSSVLHTLAENPEKFNNTISKYLRGLAETKRFSTLAMFLSTKDKHLVNNLLIQCKDKESCSEEVINDLKNKYEI